MMTEQGWWKRIGAVGLAVLLAAAGLCWASGCTGPGLEPPGRGGDDFNAGGFGNGGDGDDVTGGAGAEGPADMGGGTGGTGGGSPTAGDGDGLYDPTTRDGGVGDEDGGV